MERRAVQISEQILEEASAWFIDFNENQVDRAGREAFNAWLRRSPECVRAFLQVAAFWEDAGAFKKWSKVDTESLIARALAERNVFHLRSLSRDRSIARNVKTVVRPHTGTVSAAENGTAQSNPVTVKGRGRAAGWLVAATVLLMVGASVGTWYAGYVAPTYVTGIGEQRSVTLEDGSVVELNVRSRLRVRFTEKQRLVELLEGQALFSVTKDPERPFVVTTVETHVRAVGTQFDVYRKRGGTVVTVVHGRVAVGPVQANVRGGAPGQRSWGSKGADGRTLGQKLPEVLVAAGEQVTVTPSVVPPPSPVDTGVATAWTEKKLVFDSAPLSEVVEEFNRYNRRQLVIRDPQLLDFHVSGVFPSTDSSRMLAFLRQRFGVAMNGSSGEIEIFRRDMLRPSTGETEVF